MSNSIFEENVKKYLPQFESKTNEELIETLELLYDDFSDLSKLDTLYAVLMYTIEARFAIGALIRETIRRIKNA